MVGRMVILGLVVVLWAAIVGCGGAVPSPTSMPTATSPATLVITPTAKATPTPTSTAGPIDLVALGKSLSARNGCTACHSSDGSATIGPTWQGLYEKEETLADGSTVFADDAYLHESIVDPDAKIVKGFSGGIMPPTFGDKLSEEEITAIIEYMRTLK